MFLSTFQVYPNKKEENEEDEEDSGMNIVVIIGISIASSLFGCCCCLCCCYYLCKDDNSETVFNAANTNLPSRNTQANVPILLNHSILPEDSTNESHGSTAIEATLMSNPQFTGNVLFWGSLQNALVTRVSIHSKFLRLLMFPSLQL